MFEVFGMFWAHTCTVVAFDSFYLGLRFLRTQAQSVWKRRDFVQLKHIARLPDSKWTILEGAPVASRRPFSWSSKSVTINDSSDLVRFLAAAVVIESSAQGVSCRFLGNE